ncbi:MAG TPA: hypothetical protein VER12_07500 [Polyangiaceae bacterium]|nr:hypothetical protein [Polyangiaceae bacterium]
MTAPVLERRILGRTGLNVSVAGLGAGGDSRLGSSDGAGKADLPADARTRLAELFGRLDHLSGQ